MTSLQHQLLDYLATQPSTGAQPDVLNLTLIKSGSDSNVYHFTLAFDEADTRTTQNFVLKTYTDTTHGKDRALKERHALHHLRSARYFVPGVISIEIDPEHLGVPFIIMEHIKGETMLAKLHSDATLQTEYARQLVGLMTGLHELGAEVLVPNMKPLSANALINREIHIMRGMVTTYGLADFTPVMDWLHDHRVPCDAPVVTHRDFHPSNVIMTETGMPFVVDWGWQISDRRYDLATTLNHLNRIGETDFAHAVHAEYERVQGAVADLDYFKVLAESRWLLDQFVTLKTSTWTATEREAFIENWLEPARYASYIIHSLAGVQLPPMESLL